VNASVKGGRGHSVRQRLSQIGWTIGTTVLQATRCEASSFWWSSILDSFARPYNHDSRFVLLMFGVDLAETTSAQPLCTSITFAPVVHSSNAIAYGDAIRTIDRSFTRLADTSRQLGAYARRHRRVLASLRTWDGLVVGVRITAVAFADRWCRVYIPPGMSSRSRCGLVVRAVRGRYNQNPST